jgi:fucose permease
MIQYRVKEISLEGYITLLIIKVIGVLSLLSLVSFFMMSWLRLDNARETLRITDVCVGILGGAIMSKLAGKVEELTKNKTGGDRDDDPKRSL